MWCGYGSSCTTTSEAPLLTAWQTLARRYCASHPNVLGADLYNEPFSATWGVGSDSQRWDLAATRIGNALLAECPAWLVVVEGVGQHGGAWRSCNSNGGCWCAGASCLPPPLAVRPQEACRCKRVFCAATVSYALQPCLMRCNRVLYARAAGGARTCRATRRIRSCSPTTRSSSSLLTSTAAASSRTCPQVTSPQTCRAYGTRWVAARPPPVSGM